MTDIDLTPDQLINIFGYSLTLLEVDDNGLIPDANDEADLNTIGTLCVLMNRIASRGDTPRDLSLSRLAILTAALLASPHLGDGKAIVRKWLIAHAEFLELQLAGNK